MGAAAAPGLSLAASGCNEADLKAAVDKIPAEERKKIAALFGGYPAGAPSSHVQRPPSAVGRFLRFVFVNDVYKLDNYPRVASAIKEFKAAAATDDAVVVSILPGDFLSPCTLTNLDGGVAMTQALNHVPIEYVMFGNHEFDLKTPQLQKRIKEFNGKWINSNVTFPEFVGQDGKPLPEYDIIQVGDKRVALSAFLLDDMSQFAPIEPQPRILPPNTSVVDTWEKIKKAEGKPPDVYIPMTHLNIKEDRAFAEAVGKHPEISKITPVLLAAHDHEVYIEEAGKSIIFKVGQDAENVGIIDIWWDADGKLCRGVHMVQAQDFPLDPGVQKFVKKELDMLASLMNVSIMDIPDEGKKLSTARVRFEPEPMVSLLLTIVKKSMPKVEIVVLQGGNVRGGTAEYNPGTFTYGDLMKEFAFDTQLAIVELPGDVIEDSIRNTRTPEGTKPFFLHCDSEAVFSQSGDWALEQVNGQPFDRSRKYTVGTYQFLLCGMGKIEPLHSYCKEHDLCPPLEVCLGIKIYFMETCMRQAWLNVLGLSDHNLSSAEFEAHVNSMFDEIDVAKDGRLHPHEIEAFLAKSNKDIGLVKFLIQSFDYDGTGTITRSELQAAAHN